jgi:hypothetical protein
MRILQLFAIASPLKLSQRNSLGPKPVNQIFAKFEPGHFKLASIGYPAIRDSQER